MFEPSGQELINIANESILNENEKIKSKYTVIIAAAKRARQLVDENKLPLRSCSLYSLS